MRTALEDTKWDLIRAHILDPDNSPLSPEKQEMMDRLQSAARILAKNPLQKHAVALHRCLYPHLSFSQACEDVRLSAKLFTTVHTFDYDFWHSWILTDILKTIQDCRNSGTAADQKIISAEHANLLRLIGEKPTDLPDPLRNEKHQFYILIQNNDNSQTKIDLNTLKDLPTAALKELNRAIYGGSEITEADAEDLLNT
jgi:hypothetical protein